MTVLYTDPHYVPMTTPRITVRDLQDAEAIIGEERVYYLTGGLGLSGADDLACRRIIAEAAEAMADIEDNA